MNSKIAYAAMAALIGGSVSASAPALAHPRHHHRHHHQRHYAYQGEGGNYQRRCDGGNGAVGTIGGGVGGALIGNAVGGGTLGTVAGGVGGALLGRTLDKKNTRHRNGC